MASREVSLFLKYPGPPVALQRLQHSFLECVIEYKSGSAGELQTLPPSKLTSQYQLKGTVTLVDDELVIQFVPKDAGLHSVRIFGDTRELCRPVAIIINRNCEVESVPYDRPVRINSSLFQPSHQGQPPQVQQMGHSPQSPGISNLQYSPPSVSQRGSMMSQPQDRDSFWKDFPADPSTSFQGPISPPVSPQHGGAVGNVARHSYASSAALSGRPLSMSPADEAAFAGDLLTTKPEENSFSSLHSAKMRGAQVYGRRRAFMAVDHRSAMTPDTFRMLERDIDSVVTRGHKGKQRCAICSKKVKMSKLVELGEEEYCEPCFKRQFLLRSAIEHFMVPSIQECTVEVPVNKKATKFVSARKTIPNVNLRGLAPHEVKFAIQEFRKFSPEDDGWINKAVLIPLMKACFSYNLTGQEIKALLTSQALQSVMTSFGLDERDEVHEIEFLALLAFVARERQRLKSSTDPNNRFTGADLQMAYAFRNHFGTQRQGPSTNPPSQNRPSQVAYANQPTDVNRFRTSSAPPQGFASQAPLRRRQSQMQQQQLRESQLLARSSVDSYMHSPSKVPLSPNANPLLAGPKGDGSLSPTSPQNPLGFRSKPPSQYDFSQLQQPHAQFPQSGMGVQLDASNTSVFPDQGTLSQQQEGGGLRDLPEEDQEEVEMPTLPPNKDPSGQTITNPLLSKRPPNSKKMMEELKLTGGSADSWMLY